MFCTIKQCSEPSLAIFVFEESFQSLNHVIVQTLHVLAVLPVPVPPELQHAFNFIYMMRMINVAFLAGQAILYHEIMPNTEYF